jgi:hypothetical protein
LALAYLLCWLWPRRQQQIARSNQRQRRRRQTVQKDMQHLARAHSRLQGQLVMQAVLEPAAAAPVQAAAVVVMAVAVARATAAAAVC